MSEELAGSLRKERKTMNTRLQRVSALLETIYIDNHPDRRASGMGSTALLYWGLRMGLISEAEKNEIMGF